MFTLSQTGTFSDEIRKSRFSASAGPIDSEEAARRFIAAHADPGAHHNCWAWRLGQHYRFNDDGEVGGTAGKPILQAIDGQKLDKVVVLVSRRFGGILLGTGGLVRAYGGTAASCLRATGKIELIAKVEAAISCGFSDLALLEARLGASPGAAINARNYTAHGVELMASLPEKEAPAILRMLTDITSGRVIARVNSQS